MIIDSSAVLAIFQKEPEYVAFVRAVSDAERVLLSVVNYVECAIVIGARYGAKGEAWLDTFIDDSRIEIHPIDRDLAHRARRAYSIYGKGYHRAKLNLGDTFSYALSKSTGEPLLFKGDDFHHTDITPAL